MNHPLNQRIVDLIRVLDELTADFPSTDGMDINEIMGMYDGRLMTIRDTWQELKSLLGIFGENQSPEQN